MRRTKKQSTIENLDIDQLRCRGLRHAWEDVDMMPMIWGVMRVEHWRLVCDRCRSEATEYRDSVTCERVGTRQYRLAPGYSLPYKYTQADIFAELRARRLSTPGVKEEHDRALRSFKGGKAAGTGRVRGSSKKTG